jgi:hypothetical protein
LLVVQLVFAILAAGAVVWFLEVAWFPAIDEAIRHLPASGEIRAGKLVWTDDTPKRLAEGHFLALAVDLNHEGMARSPAHLAVEFGEQDVKVFSLFGFMQRSYPRKWTLAFNRNELEPRWGAWRPAILAVVAGAVIIGLLGSWAGLATVYFLPAWLAGFFANRDLTLAGSWLLAGAALMPGALFLTGSIVCYGLGALDLVRLGAACALHFAVGWIYVLLGLWRRSLHPEATTAKNPFTSPKSSPNP